MALKDLMALFLIATAIPVGVAVACVSRRARDAAFVFMTFGCAITDRMDVNFVTRFWYRGTTRGFEFSFIDVLAISVLLSSLLLPRPGQSRAYWPASLGFMILYFLYCCFSVLISDPKLFGLFELSKVLRAIVVFLAAAMFVRTERELGLLVFGLGCAVCLEGMTALRHRYLYGIYRVPGTLDHPNSLSMYLCTVAPVFVAAANSTLRRWLKGFSFLALAAAAVTILMTISRAGIPIFAAVVLGATACCVSFRISLKKIVVATTICLAIAGMLYRSWGTLMTRFSADMLEEEYVEDNFENRGFYFRIAHEILADRFFGVGLNNWSWWVSSDYGPRLRIPYEGYPGMNEVPSKESLASFVFAPPAHSLAVITAGELGWVGLAVFGLVWLRWFQMGASFLWRRSPEAMRRLGTGFFFATAGIFLQSVTEWTYRQTAILFTFHILLGALASLYHARRPDPPSAVAPGEISCETAELAESVEPVSLSG
jgi:hypothetical protein